MHASVSHVNVSSIRELPNVPCVHACNRLVCERLVGLQMLAQIAEHSAIFSFFKL